MEPRAGQGSIPLEASDLRKRTTKNDVRSKQIHFEQIEITACAPLFAYLVEFSGARQKSSSGPPRRVEDGHERGKELFRSLSKEPWSSFSCCCFSYNFRCCCVCVGQQKSAHRGIRSHTNTYTLCTFNQVIDCFVLLRLLGLTQVSPSQLWGRVLRLNFSLCAILGIILKGSGEKIYLLTRDDKTADLRIERARSTRVLAAPS